MHFLNSSSATPGVRIVIYIYIYGLCVYISATRTYRLITCAAVCPSCLSVVICVIGVPCACLGVLGRALLCAILFRVLGLGFRCFVGHYCVAFGQSALDAACLSVYLRVCCIRAWGVIIIK
jgi:hypothetical protein